MSASPYMKIVKKPTSRYLVDDFTKGLTTLFDEGALGYKAASAYGNFRTQSGVLTDGWGVQICADAADASNVASAWEYVRNDECGEKKTLMYCDTQGFVHEIKDGADSLLDGVKFTSPPLAIGYRLYGEDVALLCSETDGMAVYNGVNAYAVDASPTITSMALHYERLFVTTAGERNCVRFSDDLDPTNWAQDLQSGGFVQLVDGYGKSNKVISFAGYLYVFRDYGISRMTAYADQSDFSVTNLYVSAGQIYPRSVAVCGDRVLFLSSDGLFVFDGLSTSRLLPQLKDITPYKESAAGCFCDGKYYLAYSASGKENDSLLVYDFVTKNVELSNGFCLASFLQGSRLAAVSGGRIVEITPCGSVLGVPTQKVWRVPYNGFSRPDKVKRLKEIYLETATDIVLTVLYDGKEKRIDVKGKAGVQRLRAGVGGRKLGLQINAADSGVRIAEVALRIGV